MEAAFLVRRSLLLIKSHARSDGGAAIGEQNDSRDRERLGLLHSLQHDRELDIAPRDLDHRFCIAFAVCSQQDPFDVRNAFQIEVSGGICADLSAAGADQDMLELKRVERDNGRSHGNEAIAFCDESPTRAVGLEREPACWVARGFYTIGCTRERVAPHGTPAHIQVGDGLAKDIDNSPADHHRLF